MPQQIRPVLAAAAFLVYLFASLSIALKAGQAPADARPSVWDGVFTGEQATRGRTFFGEHCAGCHGAGLEGGEGPALGGDQFWTSWRETTVGELFSHVSRNMPHSEDGSLEGTLSISSYVDIVAFILQSNRLPAGAKELTADAAIDIRIIARDGPGELPATTLAHVVGCLTRGDRGGWRLVSGSPPVRMRASSAEPNRDAPLGDREYALMFVLTRLDKFVGFRMSVTGLLIGEGGVDGLNVTSVTPVAEECQ